MIRPFARTCALAASARRLAVAACRGADHGGREPHDGALEEARAAFPWAR